MGRRAVGRVVGRIEARGPTLGALRIERDGIAPGVLAGDVIVPQSDGTGRLVRIVSADLMQHLASLDESAA